MARNAKWRGRWIAVLALATGIAIAAAATFLVEREPAKFTREQFEQLHIGMTEVQVISVLGVPAGDYRPTIWSNPDWFCSPSDCMAILQEEHGQTLSQLEEIKRREIDEWIKAGRPIPPPARHTTTKEWYGRKFGITIVLDEAQRVIHASHWDMIPPRPPPDPIRWVRWWLGI